MYINSGIHGLLTIYIYTHTSECITLQRMEMHQIYYIAITLYTLKHVSDEEFHVEFAKFYDLYKGVQTCRVLGW